MMKHIVLMIALGWIMSQAWAQTSWNSLGSGITGNNLKVHCLSVPDDQTIWAATRTFLNDSNVPAFTRSLNGGASWNSDTLDQILNTPLTPVSLFALNGEVAWMVTEKFDTRDSAVIFKTINGGNNWTAQTGGFSTDSTGLKAVYFWDANNGFALGSAGTNATNQSSTRMYTSSDGGSTWTEVASTPTGEGSWTESGTQGLAVVGDHLWFGTTAGNVWRSDDRGQSWASASTTLGQNISSVAFKDSSNGVCVSENRVGAVTTDGGATWTPIADFSTALGALSPTNVLYVPKTADTYLAFNAPFSNTDIAYSNDGGLTWSRLNALLSMESMVFLDLETGFGGGTINSLGQGGIFEWIGTFPGAVNNEDIFSESERPRIYPNPVRSYATISTQLSGAWSYEIYDSRGSLIKGESDIFANQQRLDLSDLVEGFYLVKIVQGNKSLVQKLIKE